MSVANEDIRPNDRFIPWLVVLFFAVFIGVDAIMATLAIRTQTGVVTEESYEKGLAYNQTLQAQSAQQSWNWHDEIAVTNDNIVTFTLHDRNNAPVDNVDVKAQIIRPISAGHDFEIILFPQGNGIYSAPADFPLKGEWHIRIWAQCTDRLYQANKTILVN